MKVMDGFVREDENVQIVVYGCYEVQILRLISVASVESLHYRQIAVANVETDSSCKFSRLISVANVEVQPGLELLDVYTPSSLSWLGSPSTHWQSRHIFGPNTPSLSGLHLNCQRGQYS